MCTNMSTHFPYFTPNSNNFVVINPMMKRVWNREFYNGKLKTFKYFPSKIVGNRFFAIFADSVHAFEVINVAFQFVSSLNIIHPVDENNCSCIILFCSEDCVISLISPSQG